MRKSECAPCWFLPLLCRSRWCNPSPPPQQITGKHGSQRFATITPERPIWLTGFGARTNVSQGTVQDLYATALALEDGGYEGGGVMVYYLQPGPFSPSIEETILRKPHELVDRMRNK